ncbi:hypothetical protein [Flavobacterium sp.]|uniref:hypothetical protein n=1 Tax=Flavobacterium sp. TaxID=239 RepID=UPI003F69D963
MKILVCLLTINSVAFSQSRNLDKPSIKSIRNNDSIYYMAHIVIEGYSRTEMITVRRIDSLYYANIDVQSSRKEDNFKISTMVLSNSQVDTLVKFENSIYSMKINHNQGLRFSGRLGRYFIFYADKKYEFESRELFGLVDALEINE